MSSRDGGHDLYRVRPDGTALERLTIGAEVTRDLSQWSPDGSTLAIQTARGKNYDVELRPRRRSRAHSLLAREVSLRWPVRLVARRHRDRASSPTRDGYDALLRRRLQSRRLGQRCDWHSR